MVKSARKESKSAKGCGKILLPQMHHSRTVVEAKEVLVEEAAEVDLEVEVDEVDTVEVAEEEVVVDMAEEEEEVEEDE